MNSSYKVIRGLYDDDDVLMASVKHLRKEGISIKEVYTPFPVHGLDKAMGLEPTRIAICSFLFGLFGLGLSIWFTWYMMIYDWPQDIGGKPNFYWGENMPAFVPILFELTVFCAAHLMVITFYLRSNLFPGSIDINPDPRTTDDKFMMEVYLDDNNEKGVSNLLKETGAIEITVNESDH